MQSRFELVVVIGCGKIAGDVLRHVTELREKYGYRVRFIEHEIGAISRMRAVCAQVDVPYEQITDKAELTERLLALEGPTLVVSAGNHYLFPGAVVQKKNLEIINFHNALLPKLPGRNAPSWAIYLREPVSGPTWHYVAESVDSGAIIAQRETRLTEDVKAYELTRDIMALAYEAFQAFYEQLLQRHIAGTPQPVPEGKRKIFYSYEVPGGGRCSITEPAEDIYRLLRALDYGKNGIFPAARIRLEDGSELEVLRYGKTSAGGIDRPRTDEENERLYLPMKGENMLTIRYRKSGGQDGGVSAPST